MPDGMTPENRPITPDFKIGGVTNLPANEVSMQAAQNEFKPEWKSNMPDIRMQLSREDQEAYEKAAITDEVNRHVRSGESLRAEQIAFGKDNFTLYCGLRSLEKTMEDGNIPSSIEDRWSPPREFGQMYERADNLSKPVDTLLDMGWIKEDPEGSGKYAPAESMYAALALSMTPRIDWVKSPYDEKDLRPMTKYDYDFGKQTETMNTRVETAHGYEKGKTELEARAIMGDHISIRTSLGYRDSLEELTAIMHSGRIPYFKSDHLKAIFNMPSVEELKPHIELSSSQTQEINALIEKKNIERLSQSNRPLNDEEKEAYRNKFRDELIRKELDKRTELGDQVEEAIFLNLMMLNSSDKARMQEFLKRPRAETLIKHLAKKSGLSYEDWTKKYVGEVEKWENDDNRILTDDVGKRRLATWRIEANDGRRGEITKWANISAWGGNPSEFNAEKELGFIEGAIGEAVGSKEASWISATMMRVIGAYASEGWAAIAPNPDGTLKGKFLLPLGEGRYISGDDTGKFMANLFNLKEGLKGRASGLAEMIGYIPDMPMNLFDWAGVEVDGPQYPRNWDGSLQRRSIWDAWLGTPEQPLKDLITGKNIEVIEISKLDSQKQRDLKVDGIDYAEVVRTYDKKNSREVVEYRKLDLDTRDRIVSGRLAAKEDGGKKHLWVLKEDGQRLGDIRFETLERDFHGTFTIMQWLMGNGEGPTGVFIDALKTDFRYEDFALQELKKKIKYIGIVMNPVVLTKGSQHLYKDAGGATGEIQTNFFKNLMYARMRSSSFNQNILPGTVEMVEPGGGKSYISKAQAIEVFIKKALEENPKNAAELINRYVDQNDVLRTLPNNSKTSSFLEFVKSLATGRVGRVRGKHKI